MLVTASKSEHVPNYCFVDANTVNKKYHDMVGGVNDNLQIIFCIYGVFVVTQGKSDK